jgi:hypothetical protein
MAAVLTQRLSAGGKARELRLEDGWLGNEIGHVIAPFATAPFSKNEASWFPDEASAMAWRRISGADN